MGIKLKDSVRNEYLEFQMKIMLRFCVNAVISVAAVIVLYLFLWRQRGGNLIVWFLNISYEWNMSRHFSYTIIILETAKKSFRCGNFIDFHFAAVFFIPLDDPLFSRNQSRH